MMDLLIYFGYSIVMHNYKAILSPSQRLIIHEG